MPASASCPRREECRCKVQLAASARVMSSSSATLTAAAAPGLTYHIAVHGWRWRLLAMTAPDQLNDEVKCEPGT
jgi:hypothetical protein